VDLPALDALLRWIDGVGYLGLFLLMFADTAMLLHFVPGLALVAGILLVVATSPERLVVAYLVMTAGSLLGTSALYAVFATGGRRLLDRHGRLVGVGPARLAKLEALFQRRGVAFSLFALRFVPIVRVLITIPAALARTGWRRFLAYSAPGIMLFNAGFVLLVYGARHATRGVWLAGAAVLALAALGLLATRGRGARG
jgi:membrane-associated protein